MQRDLEARLDLKAKFERETEALMKKKYKQILKKVHLTTRDEERFPQFMCSSCNELMMAPPRSRVPKLLPCYHTVCAVCLKTLHVHGLLCCPVCKAAVKIEAIEQVCDDATLLREIRVRYVPPPCYPVLDLKKVVMAKKVKERNVDFSTLR